MSEAEDLDEHIRNEFSNYSPDVSPRIWDRIVAEREKRKPAGFWFTLFANKTMLWFAGLLLAGAIGTGLFMLHSSSTNNTINNNDKIKMAANDLTVAADNTTGNNNNNTSSIKTENNNNVHSATDQSEIAKGNIDKPAKKETLGNDIIIADKTTNDIVTEKPSSSFNKIKHVFSYRRGSHHGKMHSSFVNGTPGLDANDKNVSANNNKTVINSDETPLDNNNTIALTDERSQTVNIKQPKTIKQYFQDQFLSKAEKITVTAANGQLASKQNNVPAINLPECPSVEKDAAANKRYFEFYIGPDYGLRTLTDTANSVYLEKRKESSKFTSGFSAGVRYTKVFNNGMSLRAALNFSQINEKFTFIQGSVVQITYIIDPNTGDTTGSYTVRGTRYKTTYNHYRSIDIPLTIGYELGNGRLHANVNAGIIANIYSWQVGDVLDTNYQPVSITTGKGSSFYQFKTNVGLGATGGVSLYYKLNDQFHLLAEPYVRYNFQPMSTDNLTLRQKYTTIGLRLGLRVDLP